MEKLKLLLVSRKFWAAVIGLALVILKAYHPNLPLQEDELTRIITLLVAYICGTAVEDGFGRSRPPADLAKTDTKRVTA